MTSSQSGNQTLGIQFDEMDAFAIYLLLQVGRSEEHIHPDLVESIKQSLIQRILLTLGSYTSLEQDILIEEKMESDPDHIWDYIATIIPQFDQKIANTYQEFEKEYVEYHLAHHPHVLVS